MIDGLLLNSLRTSPSRGANGAILTPTPIKPSKHHALVSTIAGLATPSMIPSTSFPSQSSTTLTSTHHATGSPTIDWTHERIIRLIQMYEKKTVLWNPSNPEYFHRDIRNMVYEDLVRELNIPDLTVNETKRKLENLRSYFRRETKKLQDHERKTSEKIVSRWPYYECLQFIQEFMSVKNEAGSEVGFQKNFGKSTVYQLPTMKRESNTPGPTPMECAVQVPIGSTPSALESVASAFSVANTDLMAVLKALQGPLAETAVSCFGMNGTEAEQTSEKSPYQSPDQSTRSPQAMIKESDVARSCTPTALPPTLPVIRQDNGEATPKKRRMLERECSQEDLADLCGDYGRTVAHQLREMSSYERDLCRLQIDKLIFDVMHKGDVSGLATTTTATAGAGVQNNQEGEVERSEEQRSPRQHV